MPSPQLTMFPLEQRLLSELGERLRQARERRGFSHTFVARGAGVSLAAVCKVEAGDPEAVLGLYLRVLAVLGLEGDLGRLAADERVIPRVEELGLGVRALPKRGF
ncbi:helix-turn-helix domain-containing protein [Comamonadaceae bacterium PP-2]